MIIDPIRRTRLGISLLAALALAGCTATTLFSYNDALLELYETKLTSDQDWVAYENAIGGLDLLADEAAKTASTATDPANKIALYRVAATAAWQSGRSGTRDLVSEGIELCKDEANSARAPRDCGMLQVIPVLAAIDLTTARYNEVLAAVRAPGVILPGTHGAAAGEIFTDLHDGAALLIRAKKTLGQFPASPGFHKAVEDNTRISFDLVQKSYELVRLANQIRIDKDAACAVEALRDAAEQANVAASARAPLANIDCPAEE